MKKMPSTSWLDFITFVYLPFYLLANVVTLFSGVNIYILLPTILNIIFSLITFYFLFKRKYQAYYLLFIFIFISLFSMGINIIRKYQIHNISFIIVEYVIGIIIWLIPNYIYIVKRRKFFNKHHMAHIKKCPGCNRIIPIEMKCCGKCNYKER